MVWCPGSGAVDLTEMTEKKQSYKSCERHLGDSPDLANPCESNSESLSCSSISLLLMGTHAVKYLFKRLVV